MGEGGKDSPALHDQEAAFLRLIYCFCQGISLTVTARSTGLSVKTVRRHYLALRVLLLRPAFNRWHGTNIRLLLLDDPDLERTVRLSFFGRIAECARNYRLGNRKSRQCQACPLAKHISDARRTEAYLMIDTVHRFYETLGRRGEKAINPVLLFRKRLIHTTVIGTVHTHSHKLANGFSIRPIRGF